MADSEGDPKHTDGTRKAMRSAKSKNEERLPPHEEGEKGGQDAVGDENNVIEETGAGGAGCDGIERLPRRS